MQNVGVGRDGAHDEDDPPYVAEVDDVGDVETSGGTCSVVCSAILTFFSCLVLHQSGRDILSCASLTRTLRATPEDMALMFRALHLSV